ncbi:hypothetical protein Rwratislav_48699 [Rhodococcus wratislaviensis IFP 2016]|nr:hypothetical protein Rwratislav_48699 [Rhodococcus wratislaviensis IFP 2016]
MMNNLIAGIDVVLPAVGFTSAYGRTHGMAFAFVAPLLGVWMIISPWVVAGVATTTGMIWSERGGRRDRVSPRPRYHTAIGTRRYMRDER